ncbi:MAG TPA: efflux RND transporter periplasmic adaptor subunit [Drouetiella sp.]|jgi:multidrug efflux pump subunit AcrA (membrane-fusion protein)
MNKLAPILLIALSLLLAACNEAPKPPAMPPAAVAIENVHVGPHQDKSLYLGTIKSRKSVTLSPNIEGIVTEIDVTAGEMVNTGHKIMKIDSLMQTAQTNAVAAQADSVQSDLQTARATLKSLNSTLQSKQSQVDYTKTQYARYVKLCSEGAVSQSDLDTWKNNMLAAIADRDSTLEQIEAQKMTIQKIDRSHKQAISSWQAQKEQLKYYSITAPFAGMVGDIPVKVGDRVTSSTALTTLTENHPLEVYISIPAEKASLMHMGMNVELVSTDGKDFGNSKVMFIAPTVDSSSQTVLVKTIFPNAKNELRADQAVRAQFVWDTTAGISVPTKAVSQIGGKYFVFLAQRDGEKLFAKQVEIQVGEIEGASYNVKSGLKPSDRIITTGIQRLADGAPIADKVEMAEKSEANQQGSKSTH